jgi:hypothetical protein
MLTPQKLAALGTAGGELSCEDSADVTLLNFDVRFTPERNQISSLVKLMVIR